MKHLLTILLLALTCTALHAQSVVVWKTGVEHARGTATVTTNVSVLTNLTISGSLIPDITETNYLQIENIDGYPAWSCTNIPEWTAATTHSNVYVHFDTNTSRYWINGYLNDAYGERWSNASSTVIGTYQPSYGVTGTTTVAYWYQTNYSSVVSVTVHGKATP